MDLEPKEIVKFTLFAIVVFILVFGTIFGGMYLVIENIFSFPTR